MSALKTDQKGRQTRSQAVRSPTKDNVQSPMPSAAEYAAFEASRRTGVASSPAGEAAIEYALQSESWANVIITVEGETYRAVCYRVPRQGDLYVGYANIEETRLRVNRAAGTMGRAERLIVGLVE